MTIAFENSPPEPTIAASSDAPDEMAPTSIVTEGGKTMSEGISAGGLGGAPGEEHPDAAKANRINPKRKRRMDIF